MFNPLIPFMNEIAELVLKPKIDHVLTSRTHEISSHGDITRCFNEEFDTKISDQTMRRWLDMIGYKATRRFIITAPPRPEDHHAGPVPPSPQSQPAPEPRQRPRMVPGVGGLLHPFQQQG